ncbi:MAG: FecCD family ABC transporter permease [Gammaproteobacteria bacterium]
MSPRFAFAALAALCGILFFVALTAGLPGDALHSAFRGLLGVADANVLILREIRLPRASLALLIGAGLGVSGAALQALLRNPLAEPGVLGISAGAALGAVIVFYSGLSLHFGLALPLGGLAGAVLVTGTLYVLARREISTVGLILAGVAINSFAGACVALALNLAPNPYAAYEISFWLMGSVTDRSLVHMLLVAPFILAGIGVLIRESSRLEPLVLGEETAASLGVDLQRLRRRLIIGTALAVGPGVAIAGTIAFVGMLVPHALRPWVSHAPRVLLPASALGGAALTLAADLLVRVPFAQNELKLGVITGLLGAPLFLVVALRLPARGALS